MSTLGDDGLTVDILGAGVFNTDTFPKGVFRVDTSGRPDVAAMLRGRRIDARSGVAMRYGTLSWGPHRVVAMDVLVKGAAPCELRLIFDRALHLDALRACAAGGRIWLTDEPITFDDRPQMVVLKAFMFDNLDDVVKALAGMGG